MPHTSTETTPLLLKRCDLSQCEGMCCYDGVYLEAGEEEQIRTIVASHPDFFAFVSGPLFVDGNWKNLVTGRKIATVPHTYQNPQYPAHFPQTRCVLRLSDACCSLQVLASRLGKHPWTYKPKACWMHPLLREGSQGLIPPPIHQADDPDRIDEQYPGFVTYTPCGQHQEDGSPWEEVLAEEISYYQRVLLDEAEITPSDT